MRAVQRCNRSRRCSSLVLSPSVPTWSSRRSSAPSAQISSAFGSPSRHSLRSFTRVTSKLKRRLSYPHPHPHFHPCPPLSPSPPSPSPDPSLSSSLPPFLPLPHLSPLGTSNQEITAVKSSLTRPPLLRPPPTITSGQSGMYPRLPASILPASRYCFHLYPVPFSPLHSHLHSHPTTSLPLISPLSHSHSPIHQKVTSSVSSISEIVARHTSKLKDNATTRKMALSKLKQNAIGQQSVPQNKRFYLEVVYPMDSKVTLSLFYPSSLFSHLQW